MILSSKALFLATALVSLATCQISNRRSDAATLIIKDCQIKSSATQQDVETLIERKTPRTHSGMCLLECVFSRANIMKNGVFNKSGFIKAVTPATKGDGAKLQTLSKIADVCEKDLEKSSPDKCKNAISFVECAAKYGQLYGYKFGKVA